MASSRWEPSKPYDALPLLPPSPEIETRAVLKAAVEARSALAELKQAANLIPNQAMLINTLPLLEAQASSEIENIVTTADKLFQALSGDEKADPATKEALRYREALLAGFRELRQRPLGVRTAEAIATRIKGVEMAVRMHNDVLIANPVTREVIYTPPQGAAHRRDLLANWEQFLHAPDDTFDPLTRLAIGHYQFEAIHPFTDGNGRTGRVLNGLYLIERELLSLPVLYLSRYIMANRSDYYRLLLAVTNEANWEEWLVYMIRGVDETARWTLDKIGAIRDLMTETRAYVQAALPRIYRHELIDLIFEQPYARIGTIVRSGLAERQTASHYLKQLARIGVLREQKHGREKLFIHTRLLALLTTDSNTVAPFGPLN